ncbi:MAG: hypothetical protein Cons2KO_09980 [Congregibacter sp.]
MANETTLRTVTEFIGAISIFVSLVFVGLELRHANNVAEVDAVLQINAMYAEMLIAASHDPDLIRSLAEKSDREEQPIRIGFRNLTMINIVEGAWKSFDRGIMEEAHFLSYVNDMCQNVFPNEVGAPISTPGGDTAWERLKLTLSPEFAEVVESRC